LQDAFSLAFAEQSTLSPKALLLVQDLISASLLDEVDMEQVVIDTSPDRQLEVGDASTDRSVSLDGSNSRQLEVGDSTTATRDVSLDGGAARSLNLDDGGVRGI
jgi:hypothetical protein